MSMSSKENAHLLSEAHEKGFEIIGTDISQIQIEQETRIRTIVNIVIAGKRFSASWVAEKNDPKSINECESIALERALRRGIGAQLNTNGIDSCQTKGDAGVEPTYCTKGQLEILTDRHTSKKVPTDCWDDLKEMLLNYENEDIIPLQPDANHLIERMLKGWKKLTESEKEAAIRTNR